MPIRQTYQEKSILLEKLVDDKPESTIDLPRTDGWSRYAIPFETVMPKGITKYMYDRGYTLDFYPS
jgi:hypothetical protein